MKWKSGDWVRFWTNNWPTDVEVVQVQIVDGQADEGKNVTGQGLYMGRGKVVRVKDGKLLIREERSNRVVEVPENDRVELMTMDYHLLTLGDLRKFLEMHSEVPDDVPILVSLPICFNCDEEMSDEPPNHPELHEPAEYYSVSACSILFTGTEQNSSDTTGAFVSIDERKEGEDWSFAIEIVPNGKEAHDALRGEEHD